MSYKNKTYVIFDGDSDMWAYAYMKGWKTNERTDFNFFDAHDIRPLTDRASVETVRVRLRERFSSAKQVIVLVGENTKNLFRFVRWEIEVALGLDLPIIVVNLNGSTGFDGDLCPPLLHDTYSVHLSFKAKIIQYALDHFPDEFARRDEMATGPRIYKTEIYGQLGL
jgi:hypothetical protein